MRIEDFAFIYKGKLAQPLRQEEAHYLLPVDHYVTQHQDRALLLLHGFASSPGAYRAMLPHLTGYDRIVCPILPGHAESIQAFSNAKAQDWRETAQTVCSQLIDTYKDVTVVGLSLGGILALELSQMFRLHHLYLLAPALKLRYSLDLALLAARLLRAIGYPTFPNYGGDFYTHRHEELSYRRVPFNAIIEILSLIKTSSYIRPNCPTDLFLGQHDKVVDSNYIAKTYAHQDNISIHWLKHSAHILPLDGDIECLIKAISC
ncbi:MAG: esterase [Legionella sp.]|nr:MAG: esterase [Legionella sp.]